MSTKVLDLLTRLSDEGLRSLTDHRPLSTVIKPAIRIARLRNDGLNLWWLEMELWSLATAEEARQRVGAEIRPHVTEDQVSKLREGTVNARLQERTVVATFDHGTTKTGRPTPVGESVPEIERTIEALERSIAGWTLPPGPHPVDLCSEHLEITIRKLQLNATIPQLRNVRDRIAIRVHDFFSATEAQLLIG